MAKHTVKLGSLEFPTKKDAKAYFQAMHARYNSDEPISDHDASELALLLQRHPRAREKIGPGVKLFQVLSAEFGPQLFLVLRVDDTLETFTPKACIDGTKNP